MDFYFALTVVKLLLEKEGHLSYKTLDRQLGLSGAKLEDIKHELVDFAGIAREEPNKGLVWIGNPTLPYPTTDQPQALASAHRAQDVESAHQTDAERRQLTVMFCDLVGSTALSTQLDPEDLRDVLTAFQDTCRDAIQRYDGFIARYMGDGMLVYFGYPQAHENDAERATRAGLDIVDAMSALNTEVAKTHDIVLSVRVGVATGPVVVGDLIGQGAAEEAAVVGETPNLAARLQGIAQPDQIVIGPEIHHIVRTLFTFDDLGRHDLKGIAQPVRAWRVTGTTDLESRHESRLRSGSSPLVGRDEELGLLLRAWETGKNGRGQVVLIQGEAGVGKSRLIEALRAPLVDGDYVWVSVRCSPYHTSTPFYPIIEHVKRAVGWHIKDAPQARLEKLETALLTQSAPMAQVVPLFASLLSLNLPEGRYPPLDMTTAQQRDATSDAIVGWMLELAESKPVLQIWEDLHWADPSTLELLGLYAQQLPTVSTLCVLTYRPEFIPPWPMRSHMTPIALNRLEKPEVEAFIRNLSDGKSLPDEVLEHIVSKADGVPLYVEELTKTIIASGMLRAEAEQYLLDGALAEMQIPSTLQDSLMARLDRAPALREVAQRGAVLGREFAYEMLNAVTALEELALQSGLDQLVDDEVLYRRGRGQHSRYIFKHALIQDVAYRSLLKRTRQQVHKQVAELLEVQFSEVVEAQPELVAHHYTEAGEVKQAVRYWTTAAERARAQSANNEAVTRATTGLSLLRDLADCEETSQLELRLQISLGHALIVINGHGAPEVEAAFTRANSLCQALGDVPGFVSAVFGLWRFNVAARSLDETQAVARQLAKLSRQQRGSDLEVLTSYALGVTATFNGRPGAAHQHLEDGIAAYRTAQRSNELFRAAQDPGVACRVYDALVLWVLGFPDQAHARLSEGIALAKELDDTFSQAFAQCWVGPIVFAESRPLTELHALVTEGLELATAHGYLSWVAMGNTMRCWSEADATGPERALASIDEALSALLEAGVEITAPYFRTLQARVYYSLGRFDEAIQLLEVISASADMRAELWWASEIERLRGECLLAQSPTNSAGALECYERALRTARDQGARSLELRAATSLARLWSAQHKRKDACDLLTQIYSWFTEGLDGPDLMAARSLLDELKSPETDVTQD